MRYQYEFIFDGGRVEIFDLAFDPATLNLEPLGATISEAWTRLTNYQCPSCPLTEAEFPQCPAARNLAFILLRFKDDISYKKVCTRVKTEARVTEKSGSLQECLSPLMGLIMATSGCPILEMLKPMAFTHLPFATDDETLFRAVSTYLFGQYFRAIEGLAPDWNLGHFKAMYQRISDINGAFSERLRVLQGNDANINALIILDTFAQIGSFTGIGEWIRKTRNFFSAYFR
jgi:hypothetical protein